MHQSDIGTIWLFKPSTCSVSNGSWKFTFPTMDGNSRIPIPVSLEIVNSFARTNVIQVIILVRVITHVLNYSDRNPVFFFLLPVQQTWCVISHLKPHIISIVFQSLNIWNLSCICLNDGWSDFLRIWRKELWLGGSFLQQLSWLWSGTAYTFLKIQGEGW